MNGRPGVGIAVFIWHNDRFLVYRRAGSHGDGTWSIPGGHLEYGESFAECAAREVMEEVGLEIGNIRFLALTNDIFAADAKHYISIWLEAEWLAGEPRTSEPHKVLDMQWCDFKHLPKPLFEPCWQNLRLAKPELFQ